MRSEEVFGCVQYEKEREPTVLPTQNRAYGMGLSWVRLFSTSTDHFSAFWFSSEINLTIHGSRKIAVQIELH